MCYNINMKIGISTASLTRLETEDALNLLKEVGAETSEVYLKTFYEYRPEFAKKYAERTAGVEVNFIRVNSQNFEPQLFSKSRRVRGDGFYWLDQILRSAQLFGAKNYVFQCLAKTDDSAERLREIADFCARYGVNLCVEHAGCPQLASGIVLKQIHAYLQDMQGTIVAVRVSKADKKVFSQLKAAGFDGAVLVETSNFKEVEELKKSVEFLKEIIYNIK